MDIPYLNIYCRSCGESRSRTLWEEMENSNISRFVSVFSIVAMHHVHLHAAIGGSSHKHSSYISMYLANRSACPVSAGYKLFVYNHDTEDEELIFQSNGVKLFETQGHGKIDGWGRDRFLPHSRCSESSICKDDTIIFSVEISVYGNIETFCHDIGAGSTLDQDMHTLYSTHMASDVEVHVDGTSDKYFLHRSILSARSPVFRTMLNSPTQENRQGVILLHDDDPLVVGDFFKFLYTDYLR